MRVLCIDVSNPKHAIQPHQMISEGEVYHVIASYLDEEERAVYYYLRERLEHPRASYRSTRFVPLSGDEAVAMSEAEDLHDRKGR